MTVVLYPGSFDPIHNGHVEIVETAARLFDRVVVASVRNPQKGQPLFSLEDRQELIGEALAHLDNVEVTMFSSLVVDLARDVEADFIVSGVDTLFIPTTSPYSFLASKLIREIARFGGNIDSMVPSCVAERLKERYPL